MTRAFATVAFRVVLSNEAAINNYVEALEMLAGVERDNPWLTEVGEARAKLTEAMKSLQIRKVENADEPTE